MQASKAKGAAFLYPNGLFVLKFDSLDGAFLGAESAADALVFYAEELGLALVIEVCIGNSKPEQSLLITRAGVLFDKSEYTS